MKNLNYLFFVLLATITSCKSDSDVSDAYGNFEATSVFISSDVSGKILFMNIEEGDKPAPGKLVGIIDTLSFHLTKGEIEAQQSSINSKLQNLDAQAETFIEQKKALEVDLKRTQSLYKDGAATTKMLDDLEGRLNVLNAQIRGISVQKESVKSEAAVLDQKMFQVKDKIQRCYIYNPISGTVLEKYAEMFEMAVAGKPLYKIADLSFMELKVYVDGVLISDIKLGQNVKVFIDVDEDTNREIIGEVTWISSQAEFTPKIIQTKEERVKLVYAIKIKVPNDGYLKIGMPGEVMFN